VASGRFTMGEKTEAYEKAFADYIGTKYAIACNSGSSANLLMVAAYTLRFGVGTVIVPAVAWATSYSPFQQYGWSLVFR
jgi:CDP-6-deoxy-D-xylo-4-hexulose-3-dehydrase